MTAPAPTSIAHEKASSSRLVVPAVLTVMIVGFLSFAAQYVPHLTNNMWADREFSGWTSAVAHRLTTGGRLYHDVVLPIPPGSLWVLELIETWAGRPAVLHETWVCAICHLIMALLAYAMAEPLTSRLNALFVSAGTLALITQLPKELAYDHTAQVVGWASLALLVRGLVAWKELRGRLAWLAAAGLTAGLVSMFKQSTGMGAVLGGATAIGYLAMLGLRAGGRATVRSSLASLATFLAAAAAGFGATLGAIALAGGSVGGFLRTVYLEGSALKGGAKVLLPRLGGYTLTEPTVQIPLSIVALGALVAFLVVKKERAFIAPAPHDRDADARASELVEPTKREQIALGAIMVGTFELGVLFLSLRVSTVPFPLFVVHLFARWLPALGLVLAVGYWVGGLRARSERLGRPEAFAALCIGALVAALFHNASVPEVRIFYDNNAIVAVALLAVFVALEQAGIRWLRWATFALLFVSLLGGKMERWLTAKIPVRGPGFWGGMYVSQSGRDVLKAAERVRELAGPRDEVLVLPEDLSLAMLIDRPRPKLCGAVLFVDQYPGSCVAEDLTSFETTLPKVIVTYPGWENEWQRMYRLWSSQSAAGLFNTAVFHHHIPKHFKLDSTFPAVFWHGPDSIKVFVHKTEAEEAEEAAEAARREAAKAAKDEAPGGAAEGASAAE